MTDAGPTQKPTYGLRRVAPGVVEIMGYAGRGQALLWLVGLAALLAFCWTLIESPDFLTRELATVGYGIAWGPETQWIAGYEACQRTIDFYPGCHPDVSRWEYVLQITLPLRIANGQILLSIFWLLLLLGPWLVILFTPFRPPVRLDGHRRVCYAWHCSWPFGRGRLHIAPSGAQLQTKTQHRFDAMAGDSRSGPVQIILGRADQPDIRRSFSVGTFLAGGRGLTPEQAWTQATMVFGPDADKASRVFPETFRRPWWQRLTLRSVPTFPNDVEAQVDAWLAQGGRSLP